MSALRADYGGESGTIFFALLALVVLLPALVWAEAQPWGTATVVQAPQGFSYSVAELMFDEPRTFSIGAGVTHRLEVVQVVVRGTGFRPKATGPVIWLNGLPTLRTTVSEDGQSIEAYFLEPISTIEAAAARLGRWQLIYQSHEGAREVYRISPSGSADDADRPPIIRRLSPAEQTRLRLLRHRFHLE